MNDIALTSRDDASPHTPPLHPARTTRRLWSPASLALIVLCWLVLHIGCLFSPGLLDDVDSVYIEVAREMLVRHDFVTPFVAGIRFFDKPPLMYWLAAGSMHLFGPYDWAARLPLALLTLALLLATYALGLRLFSSISPPSSPDRGALYSAIALATCVGPFLYTRFFIPDIVLALWMTLAVHLFLVAVDRTSGLRSRTDPRSSRPQTPASGPLVPMLAFAAVMALNVLTKGLIGLVFPLGFVVLYLALTRQLHLFPRLHPVVTTAGFLALAAPWHILAAIRNPPVALPPGLGLPAKAGWAWFYLYNEHIARFLSRRIPHDYGQLPIPLFWLLSVAWLIPWAAFLPGALNQLFRDLRRASSATVRDRQAATSLLLWITLVLGFFTLSARQEYYSLPTIPAFALMIGGLLARADSSRSPGDLLARSSALRWSLALLVPFASVCAIIAGYFAITAPHPAPGADIYSLLAPRPDDYDLSLGHLADLTGAAMGLFRLPLALVALSMTVIGPIVYLIRRSGRTRAANLTLAVASVVLLFCIHEGLARFYPTLGSKPLALAVLQEQRLHPQPAEAPPDLLLLDGELTSGSTILFYTRQPVHFVEGRMNGLWFGSFWPGAPAIFETNASLHQLWSRPGRVFLFTTQPELRARDLAPIAPVHTLSSYGGKAILTNH